MKDGPTERRINRLESDSMDRGSKASSSLSNSKELSKLAQNFENSGLGWFWSTDKDLRLTYISANVAECFSQNLDELIGQPLCALFKLESLDDNQTERTLPFVLNTRSKFKEITVRAAQQEIDYCWALSGRPQLDSLDNFTGYLGSGTDVTASAETQDTEKACERMSQSEADLRLLDVSAWRDI